MLIQCLNCSCYHCLCHTVFLKAHSCVHFQEPTLSSAQTVERFFLCLLGWTHPHPTLYPGFPAEDKDAFYIKFITRGLTKEKTSREDDVLMWNQMHPSLKWQHNVSTQKPQHPSNSGKSSKFSFRPLLQVWLCDTTFLFSERFAGLFFSIAFTLFWYYATILSLCVCVKAVLYTNHVWNALVCLNVLSSWQWLPQHYFNILVHVDMIASCNLCRFVRCTFMLPAFRSGYCHFHETHLRWLLLCDTVHPL